MKLSKLLLKNQFFGKKFLNKEYGKYLKLRNKGQKCFEMHLKYGLFWDTKEWNYKQNKATKKCLDLSK